MIDTKILSVFMRYSHLPPALFAPHRDALLRRIDAWTANSTTLELVMPACPYKSPNRTTKVLGPLPDAGEAHFLTTMGNLASDLSDATRRDVKVSIYPDGFAFYTHPGTSEPEVKDYLEGVRAILCEQSLTDRIGIKEWMSETACYATKLAGLMAEYSEPFDQFSARVANDAWLADRYTKIKFFYEEEFGRLTDEITGKPESKKAHARRCGAHAMRELHFSETYGKSVERMFPDALRLSVHPHQTDFSRKLPIRVGRSLDNRWSTPWHNTPIADRKGEVRLAKRPEAEALGLPLECHPTQPGRPWCYRVARFEDIAAV